jgi:ubiquinone/menaquinone biosynthesis C-methylase UbiE
MINYDELVKKGYFEEEYRPAVRVRNSVFKNILTKIENSKVLDIGSGPGVLSKYLDDSNEIFLFDISFESLKTAKSTIRNAHFIQGSAEKLPFAEGYFDVVLMLDVIEHIRNDKEVIRECTRVLRKGGRLILSVPEDMKLFNKIDKEIGHYRRYSKENIEDLLSKNFKVIYLNDIGFPFMRLYYRILPLFHNAAKKVARKGNVSILVKFLSKIIECIFMIDLFFKGNFKGIIIIGIYEKL